MKIASSSGIYNTIYDCSFSLSENKKLLTLHKNEVFHHRFLQ